MIKGKLWSSLECEIARYDSYERTDDSVHEQNWKCIFIYCIILLCCDMTYLLCYSNLMAFESCDTARVYSKTLTNVLN
jgi:hypothetical protein